MSIRLQLLVVALTTLVLPWAGCQYARELETALRDSQEKSLLASAGTIANALSAQPQRVFREPADSASHSPPSGAICTSIRLGALPLLDGYRDDWGIAADPAALPTATGYAARACRRAPRSAIFISTSRSTMRDFDAGAGKVHPEQRSVRPHRPDAAARRRRAAILFFRHHCAGSDRRPKRRRWAPTGPQPRGRGASHSGFLAADLGRLPRGGAHPFELRGTRAVGRSAATATARAGPGLAPPTRPRAAGCSSPRRASTTCWARSSAAAPRHGHRRQRAEAGDRRQLGREFSRRAEARTPGTWYRRFMSRRHRRVSRCRRRRPDRLAGNSVASALAGQAARRMGARRRKPGAAADRRGAHCRSTAARAAPWFLEQAGDQLLALRDRARGAPVQSHAARHGRCGHRHVRPRDLDQLAHRAIAHRRGFSRGQRRTRSASTCRNPRAPMRSARCRAASNACWRGSTSTHSICAPWAASCRTSCARRSPSCVRRWTIWSPKVCATISSAMSRGHGKARSVCNPS